MNVLSLFDGVSCGRLALERAGIPITNYYASEIDIPAIRQALRNYPDTKQLGTVTNIRATNLPRIDLLIGGSPCQGFSFAGKQLNFEDPRSALFFDFVRIYREIRAINPDVLFLLENVRMKQEYQDIITDLLGVEPIEINSALVSAQNRRRLYWTNIPGVKQPADKGIFLEDILQENDIPVIKHHGELKYKPFKSQCLDANYSKGVDNHGQRTVIFEPYTLSTADTVAILEEEVRRGKIEKIDNETYLIHGYQVKPGINQGEPYLFGCMTPNRLKKAQNGQRFNDGRKFYTLTTQDQHGVLLGGYIRKLTPTECERLQTMPDGYTAGSSDSQRYRQCGNGWTIDVIAHIFKNIKINKVILSTGIDN